MPELRTRAVAILAGAALAVCIGAPVALAQSDELEPPGPPAHGGWSGSSFEFPFDLPDHVVRSQPFRVAGTMRYEKTGPADRIAQVEVRVVDDPTDDRALPDGCHLPEPVVIRSNQPQPDLVATLPFEVDGLEVSCNGRYLLEAEARLDDPRAPTHTLRQPFGVAVAPPPVDQIDASLDEAARRATVTFTPLDDDTLGADSLGYVLERSGPGEGDGGDFRDVGRVDADDDPRFIDDLTRAAGGTYTYRVRAVRAGAGSPERSEIDGTATATITVGEPPAPPADAAARPSRSSPRRGTATVPRRSTLPNRSTTITTIDTGFDETIDYGDRPPGSFPDMPGDESLAGQSIIRDEGDGGLDVAAPVAGALVLLGWAGHIAYLNRLAKQL
jgi:hypothetical protein